MRVLIIDVNCKQGSTGKIAYNLYSHVISQGDEASICYGRGKKIKERNIYKFGLDWETYLHALLTRLTGYTGCFSFFSTRRLIRYIKKFKPDVVHIHELHAYFINISQFLFFLKKQNVKVIHTLHCAFSYTGKCGHHLDCDGWRNQCGNCPRLREYVATKWFDHTKSMFLKKKKAFDGFKDLIIVCPSEWLANYAKQSFLGQYKIKVIHNGVDTNVFYPRNTNELRKRLKIQENQRIVLSVAPNLMSKSKGGQLVLELAKTLDDENIQFILVGVENTEIEHANNVLLFEKTSNQGELASFYSLADLFVICSEMENFPTTCLEAQCCGTPICGFDVGGVAETNFLKHNAFFKYGDILSLSNFISSYLKNSDKHTTELFRKAANSFSKNKMCSDYYKLYKR